MRSTLICARSLIFLRKMKCISVAQLLISEIKNLIHEIKCERNKGLHWTIVDACVLTGAIGT